MSTPHSNEAAGPYHPAYVQHLRETHQLKDKLIENLEKRIVRLTQERDDLKLFIKHYDMLHMTKGRLNRIKRKNGLPVD